MTCHSTKGKNRINIGLLTHISKNWLIIILHLNTITLSIAMAFRPTMTLGQLIDIQNNTNPQERGNVLVQQNFNPNFANLPHPQPYFPRNADNIAPRQPIFINNFGNLPPWQPRFNNNWLILSFQIKNQNTYWSNDQYF